jgi:hypothetical protein
MQDITNSITKKAKKLRKEVRQQTGVALAAAFAFVIAFSWNEFLKEIVAVLVSMIGLQSAILLKLAAAAFATIIGFIGIKYFSRWGK